jgi:hypothetical protein
MVKWTLTPAQVKAKEDAERAAQAARTAARERLASIGQIVDGAEALRVGTGAASRSVLSKSEDNTVEIIRERKAQELLAKLKAAQERLKGAEQLLASSKSASAADASGGGGKGDSASASALAEDGTFNMWEQITDADTGKVYFWNRKTNLTSWVNPSVKEDEVEAAKQRATPDSKFWVIVRVRRVGVLVVMSTVWNGVANTSPLTGRAAATARARAHIRTHDTRLHTHAQTTHTHKDTHRHTQHTHTRRHTRTHTHTHTHAYTHARARMCAHARTHTHTLAHTHNTQTHAHARTRTHRHTHAHPHLHRPPHAHTRTYTHSRTHTHTYTHTNTHTHARTHARTHTHTHTHDTD